MADQAPQAAAHRAHARRPVLADSPRTSCLVSPAPSPRLRPIFSLARLIGVATLPVQGARGGRAAVLAELLLGEPGQAGGRRRRHHPLHPDLVLGNRHNKPITTQTRERLTHTVP